MPATSHRKCFSRYFATCKHFQGKSSLRTWVYRIAVNESHNRRRWLFRHRHKEVGLQEEFEDSEPRDRSLADAGRSPYDRAFDSQKHALA